MKKIFPLKKKKPPQNFKINRGKCILNAVFSNKNSSTNITSTTTVQRLYITRTHKKNTPTKKKNSTPLGRDTWAALARARARPALWTSVWGAPAHGQCRRNASTESMSLCWDGQQGSRMLSCRQRRKLCRLSMSHRIVLYLHCTACTYAASRRPWPHARHQHCLHHVHGVPAQRASSRSSASNRSGMCM